jgi:hypothetical protein
LSVLKPFLLCVVWKASTVIFTRSWHL